MKTFDTTPAIFFWFILNLFIYFPTICFQELQPNDYRCLMKKKVVNTIEDHMNLSLADRKKQCIINVTYDLNAEFCCFDNCTVFVKWKCLMCGLKENVTENGSLCPDFRDDPNRRLSCNVCKTANPCKNNGTVVCQPGLSYASEMTCECKTGYTGKFCEEKIFVCNYTCGKQQLSTLLTDVDTNGTSCPHALGENCRFLNQYPQSKTNDVLLFCDDLPTWMYGSWSQCSKTCDEGISIRTVTCVRNLGYGNNKEFNSSACRYLEQLELVKNCEVMKCPVIKSFDINFYQIKTLSPVNILAGMKAYIFQHTSLIVECRTKKRYKNRVQWLMDGKRLRNGRYSNIKISKKKKLKIMQDFTNDNITVFTCRVGNFSIDSKVFRIGYLNRNVSLSIRTNTTAKDPSDRKRKHLYVSLTQWSSCSQPCGLGVQTRDFKCEIITDKYIQEFPKSNCPYRALNITFNKTCYIQPCVKWTYTLWTPCSKTCNGGLMKRSAICARMQTNGTFLPTADCECDNLTRDSIFKQCNLYNCSVREIVKKDIEFFQLDTVPKVYLYVGMKASVLSDSNLVIICRTRGIKIKKIRWFKNGIRVRSIRNTRISKKCKLRIKSVSLANEGKYCCRYKSHEECLYLRVYTRSKVEKVKRIRQLYQYHDTSDQFIKDPFDREKRRLNVRLSNWTCVQGEEVRKYLSCEIITNFYIEAFDTKFCHRNYFEEEIELKRRC